MRSFYDEVLLDHNMYPRYKGELEKGNVQQELVNASCGDKLTIDLLMDGEHVVDARWNGHGCAISQAAADLMVETIIDKDWDEIENLYKEVSKLVVGKMSKKEIEKLGELGALETIARMPARVKCAKLPWQIVELAGEARNNNGYLA